MSHRSAHAAADTAPHRCTDHHRSSDSASADEGPMFFSAGEYVAGAVTLLALMGIGLLLHLSDPRRANPDTLTAGGALMCLAVIPAGIVMALMERRRTTPTLGKDAA